MMEGGLHFAQPFWLLGLLMLLPVAYWLRRSAIRAAQGPLHRYADPHLLPHLTGTRELRAPERWRRDLRWSLLWTLLLVAMAGPRWDATDVRLFHPGNHLLVLLDLSRSMQVADVSPNRLARARHEMSDLIQKNRELRLGLIVFATVPLVISPLTDETQSILNALPALTTDLASPNLQGSRLAAALTLAEQLLAGLPAESARAILLISDGDFEEPDLPEQVARLAAQGVVFHTLGVGSTSGGEVPAPGGGVLRDARGEPVRSALDEALLMDLAAAGGGLYRRADFRDEDTAAILRAATRSGGPPQTRDERTYIWNERFWIPVALVMFLLLPQLRALGARRRPGR
ncbi:VWA domain-containing protein [Thiocapsa imhoffii]|uniref:VWA domain-containing protein n=1 Tax=Thiocapsa imhoffii TaxID=382777 RepID=A0A9X0WIT0_9GAMM|nr:VWA domain-containing protein [Thiocapsa imhoffii]MBK1645039.1 VWA domain-containing protein [Thiocapsa imhoffii]